LRAAAATQNAIIGKRAFRAPLLETTPMTTLAIRTAALAACLAPALAAAQTPPIKPGLWEVQGDRQVDGKPAAARSDAIKNLPPDVRARIEATMMQKGMAVGSGGASQVCLTKESLDAGRWQNSSSCRTDYGARTASSWKWHSVCEQAGAVIDGEAVFANAESYTVNTSSTRTFRGETKTTKMTIRAKWVGADCGDLKPFDGKR
jgi:hypothetical protein